MKRILPLLMLAGLVACNPAENEPGPGGVSAEDARALDEAASKLEGQSAVGKSEE